MAAMRCAVGCLRVSPQAYTHCSKLGGRERMLCLRSVPREINVTGVGGWPRGCGSGDRRLGATRYGVGGEKVRGEEGRTRRWREGIWGVVGRKRGGAVGAVASIAATSGNGMFGVLFTTATVFVMPLYTLMIAAPRWRRTREIVESPVPIGILCGLYGVLLAASWSPDTFKLMFYNQYWMPELDGICLMFGRMKTVASAWLHLLAADFLVARQVFVESIDGNLPYRHSMVLCLLFGPLGYLCHIATKSVANSIRLKKRQEFENAYGSS